MLPAALALAAVTAATKLLTGAYAASRDKVGRRGQLRAGAALIPRGEFSIVILGLAAAADPTLGALVTAYVFILRDHRTAHRPPHRTRPGIVDLIDTPAPGGVAGAARRTCGNAARRDRLRGLIHGYEQVA